MSMGANDIGTSRIERARTVVDRLTEALPSARIVLVVFADWPYTLVPPTDDPALVRYFAQALSVDLVTDRDQGTSFSSALTSARAALDARPRPGARRAIVVLSDGGAHEPLGDVLTAATEASSDGVGIWTAGLGTPSGAQLTAATGPLTDAAGGPVVATLDDEILREIATAGGGTYQDVSDDRGLRALLEGLGDVVGPSGGSDNEPLDASFWLTLLAVPLLLAEAGLDAGRGARGRSRKGEA
jgi:Ca-activated chloride channel family protein